MIVHVAFTGLLIIAQISIEPRSDSLNGIRNLIRWCSPDALSQTRCERESSVARLREQFGQKLKSIRLSKQMSQEQFAELLGISVDFLSLIERGINAPSFENLEVFSAQLGLAVSELFTFSKSPTISSGSDSNSS
jgi:DNA-binding transcriptional regulator YiaG